MHMVEALVVAVRMILKNRAESFQVRQILARLQHLPSIGVTLERCIQNVLAPQQYISTRICCLDSMEANHLPP